MSATPRPWKIGADELTLYGPMLGEIAVFRYRGSAETDNRDVAKENAALAADAFNAIELERWQHAACLSIAEGAPGWDCATDQDSPAMLAVRALRRAVNMLDEAKAALHQGLASLDMPGQDSYQHSKLRQDFCREAKAVLAKLEGV